MRTVALLVHPNQEIFAVSGLYKPTPPPHSGFIDEENSLQTHYRRELREYNEKVAAAVRCDQETALKVLWEQFPQRETGEDSITHYNVKNILLQELITGIRRKKFTIDQEVVCVNASPLPGNEIGPPLKEGKKYPVHNIVLDSEGNQHLDVGLKSTYNYISSYETEEELPNGNKIHWCHPTRFK
ncbi:MAG TPA: hypothetical protein VGE18_00610 [Candidatus Paceibacterota bacterium]